MRIERISLKALTVSILIVLGLVSIFLLFMTTLYFRDAALTSQRQSLSRVMEAVVTPEHAAAARKVRALIATYEEKRDLITLGAYAKGSDPRVDRAMAALPEIERFVCQGAEPTRFDVAATELEALAKKFG